MSEFMGWPVSEWAHLKSLFEERFGPDVRPSSLKSLDATENLIRHLKDAERKEGYNPRMPTHL